MGLLSRLAERLNSSRLRPLETQHPHRTVGRRIRHWLRMAGCAYGQQVGDCGWHVYRGPSVHLVAIYHPLR